MQTEERRTLSQFTPEEIAAAEAEMKARAKAIYEAESKPKDDLIEATTKPLTEADMAYAEGIMKRAAAENGKAVIEATDITWCSSAAEIGTVILRYVKYVMKQDKRGVRLHELNKRFGWELKKYSTTTRQLCQSLVAEGELDYKLAKGVAVYLDPIALGYEQKDKSREERERIKIDYIEKAFYSSKR